jgi:hypothetical protein
LVRKPISGRFSVGGIALLELKNGFSGRKETRFPERKNPMFREKYREPGRIFEKLGCSFSVKATSLDFFVDLGKPAGQRQTSLSTAEMGDITGTKGVYPLLILMSTTRIVSGAFAFPVTGRLECKPGFQ